MSDALDILAPIEQEGTKATVRNWLVKIGDSVSEGDAIVELETDKVTQEVSADASGTLSEILLASGSNAAPGSILGRISKAGVAPSQPQKEEPPETAAEPQSADTSNQHQSPAVRRAAAEYNIDPTTLSGSGKGGRVTVGDMEQEKLRIDQEAAAVPAPPKSAPVQLAENHITSAGSETIPHSAMRLAIADHMVQSLSKAPQVTAIFEADFTAVMRHRDKHKESFKARGINLSYTAYFIAASVAAMKKVPAVNSRWHDDFLEVFRDINIGIGTALGDQGLVVPVIGQCQHLSLEGIAEKLQDLTAKARGNRLTGADLKGGTFTISNHGTSGSLLAAPIIINQPQNAILGIGKLEKRVCVIEVDGMDTIQIRPKAYVSLTIDHRALDGYQTNLWLSEFVNVLESWPS